MLELRCRVSGTLQRKNDRPTDDHFNLPVEIPIRHADELENIVLEQL
jgi:hypothetical protein